MKKLLDKGIIQAIGLWLVLCSRYYTFMLIIGDPTDPSLETPNDLLWYRFDALCWLVVALVLRWQSKRWVSLPAALLTIHAWAYTVHEFCAIGARFYPCLSIATTGLILFEIIKSCKKQNI